MLSKRLQDHTPALWRLGGSLLVAMVLLPLSASAVVHRVPADHGTITAALAAAAAGDTVAVAAGTYSPSANGETYPLTVNADGIHLLGAGRDLATLDAEGSARVIHWETAGAGRVSGFTITGGQSDIGGGIRVQGGSPEIDHNLLVANSATASGSAMYVGAAAAPWFHHNVVWQNFDTIPDDEDDPHGIILTGTSMALVEHNLIGRTDGNGILTASLADPIIRHNLIIENGRPAPGRRGRGICNFSNITEIRIYHNLFWGNEIAAILNPDNGDDISGEEANDLDPNDMIYGNIDADPLLTDPDGMDFTLQPDSPAIDAGDPSLPGDPDGTVADLGPYYFDQVLAGVPLTPELTLKYLGNVPNPFNPSTELRFDLNREGPVEVHILDVRGRRVRNLYRGPGLAGTNSLSWNGAADDGRALPSGVYLVSVRAAERRAVGSVLLLR